MNAALFALLFAWIALPVRAADFVLDPPTERVLLDYAYDGDTIYVWRQRTGIRLAGIDTPELRGAECAAEKLLAAAARARLTEILFAATLVEVYDCHRDGERYGRQLCALRADGVDVGAKLVAEGFARPYTGRRESWCP